MAEDSASQDPNPMQGDDVQSTFARVMADIEDNDDLATRQIMAQTGAAEVKPEPGEPPPETPDTEESEEEDKADEEPKEEKPDDAAPPESDSKSRLDKLAKRGREVGNRTHQLQQREAEFEQRQHEFEARQRDFQAEQARRDAEYAAFERDPIEAWKMRGADPRQIGQRVKQLLTDPKGAKEDDRVAGLEAKVDQLTQLLTARQQEDQEREQLRAKSEAREAAHAEMKAYMSQEAAQKAYPLAARLPEPLFREYSSRAVEWLLQRQIELSQDNVCEVIKANLEEMRSVYGDAPTPPPRDAPGQEPATPAGQRPAPSIGNDSKTSGPSGPDWDTLSLGADEDDFIDKIRKEVASG